MGSIVVVDYDPSWSVVFEELRSRVWAVVGDFALAVEHVGSTSVPGLAAKPIIDMSIVVEPGADEAKTVRRLATLGYEHLGTLGIEGREAFRPPADLPAHHLYVCPEGSLGLRNHVAVRDHLRSHPETARAYSELKKTLADRFRDDLDSYIDGKTGFLLEVLKETDLTRDELRRIEMSNRK